MKTRLSIKNFRVFDENGVTFELNPITILTGSNSSGKSSVVKAICLLNSFLRQIKKAVDNGEKIELDKYKLDFNQYPINLLRLSILTAGILRETEPVMLCSLSISSAWSIFKEVEPLR